MAKGNKAPKNDKASMKPKKTDTTLKVIRPSTVQETFHPLPKTGTIM